MASDPQIDLRMSRLENDSASIYELITEIRSTQQEHSRRFEAIDGRFEAIEGRFEAIEGRFDSVEGRFEAIDGRFDSVEATLREVVRRLPEPS